MDSFVGSIQLVTVAALAALVRTFGVPTPIYSIEIQKREVGPLIYDSENLGKEHCRLAVRRLGGIFCPPLPGSSNTTVTQVR